jgi:alkylation response protein AidB-like acyl-CoA dehydrogenase
MQPELPEEIRQLRSSLRRFIERELLPKEEGIEETARSDLRRKSIDWVRKRSFELGFFGIFMPEEVGGGSLGALGTAVLKEEVARSGSQLAHCVLGDFDGPSPLLLDANEHIHDNYLLPTMRAEKASCFALSEPNAGSDAASIETAAVKNGDSYILNGTKHMVSQGARADFVIAFAVTNKTLRARGGISCFVIDMDSPGLTIARHQHAMGGYSEPVEIVFENCPVPAVNMVGQEGFGFMMAMRWLAEGRLGMASTAIGLAQLLLDLSIEHAKNRVQFGAPIARKGAIQKMIADMATELYAARMMVYETAKQVDRQEDSLRECSMTKLFATEMVNRAADSALQIHGGTGYMRDCIVERIYRDVRAMRIGEGTSEIHRMIIARSLLRS